MTEFPKAQCPCVLLAIALLVSFGAAAGAMAASPVQPVAPAVAGTLLNPRQPMEGVLTGGFTTVESFSRLAEQGYKTYLDLRTDAEIAPGIAAAAHAAGLEYRRLAIAGEGDLDLESARTFDALLDDRSAYPLVVACGSGNRVGALFAAKAFWLDGATGEQALDLGRRAGLTKLEPSVRLLLGLSKPSEPEPVAPPR